MDDFFCTYLLCNPTGFATWPHRWGFRDVGGCAKWSADSRRVRRLCGGNHEQHRHTSCVDTSIASLTSRDR